MKCLSPRCLKKPPSAGKSRYAPPPCPSQPPSTAQLLGHHQLPMSGLSAGDDGALQASAKSGAGLRQRAPGSVLPGAGDQRPPPKDDYDPVAAKIAKQQSLLRSYFGNELLLPGEVGDAGREAEAAEEEQLALLTGAVAPHEVLTETEVIGIYFGAQRSDASREFEPLLRRVYERKTNTSNPAAGKTGSEAEDGDDGGGSQNAFEVVYVSADRTEEEFARARQAQPQWLALPFCK